MADVRLDLDSPEARDHTEMFDNVMFDIDVLLGRRHYRQEWWSGDNGTAWACFNDEGQVESWVFIPVRR
jgi:hypothetical protein